MFNKLKPEVKRLWVEALRSGKYKQARGTLQRDDDSYCCMGVLCRLPGSPVENVAQLNASYPIPEVKVWAGFIGEHRQPIMELTALNDVDGLTFPQIADWIEENL